MPRGNTLARLNRIPPPPAVPAQAGPLHRLLCAGAWTRSFLWFYLAFLYLECMVRLAASSSFWGVGLLYIALFALAPALVLAGLRCLLPPVGGAVLEAAALVLMTLLYVIQLFYYFVFKTFLILYSLLNGTQALQFGDTIAAVLGRHWPRLLCLLLPLAAWAVVDRGARRPRAAQGAAVCAALTLAAHLAAVASLGLFGTGYFTPRDYYRHPRDTGQTVDRLGLYTTVRLDAQRLWLGQGEQLPEEAAPLAADAPTHQDPPAAPRPADVAEPEPEYGYNVLDIDFAALAAAEPDSTLAAMHRYFGSVAPTRQNEYTGLFEGYNLITVVAESFAPYAIDPQLTPTLYKMLNEGISFSNFYCPLWGASTIDGEYATLLGLVPKQGVWSLSQTAGRGHSLPFSLGHQFGALGYTTNAFHNHNYEYYDRGVTHPNLGYTFKALGNGLEVEPTWPESDLEMVDLSTGDYAGQEPFHTYYLTVSGHQAYNFYGNQMSMKNRELVEGMSLSEEAQAYLACNLELDRAMALLLQRLEEAGVAERTVIALSPDHPPYGLTEETLAELSGMDPTVDFNFSKSVFFIYCPGMQPMVVEKPCSSLDVLPTLSNLFGLPYDSRLMTGRDILSDAEPLVVFADRSWLTDTASFNTGTGALAVADGAEPGAAWLEAMNRRVAEMFSYATAVADRDYYRLVVS